MVDTLSRLADEIEGRAPELERVVADIRTERDRLHSWAGLLSLLDEHYPADVFGGDSGDLGPRVVRLIRERDALRYSARELQRMHDECHQQRDAALAEVASLRQAAEAARLARDA